MLFRTSKNLIKSTDSRIIETIKVYEKIAKSYAEYTFDKILQYQLTQFTTFLPKKAKILDIGSGSGRDVQYLMEEGHEVVGIDLSKNLIKEAKKRVPKGKFYQMDMLEMKFCDETFDGIWCHATLCHILKLDAPKALKEMFRILKPDGVLYIGLREGEGEKMICYLKSGNLPKFFAFYTQIELEEMIMNAGFDILNSYSERDEQSAWINTFARKQGIKTGKAEQKKETNKKTKPAKKTIKKAVAVKKKKK